MALHKRCTPFFIEKWQIYKLIVRHRVACYELVGERCATMSFFNHFKCGPLTSHWGVIFYLFYLLILFIYFPPSFRSLWRCSRLWWCRSWCCSPWCLWWCCSGKQGPSPNTRRPRKPGCCSGKQGPRWPREQALGTLQGPQDWQSSPHSKERGQSR